MRRRYRQTEGIRGLDRRHCDQLRGGALRVGQMRLADLLTDGHDDALPAHHRPESQRDGHRDLDPERNELRGGVHFLLERAEIRPGVRRELDLIALLQFSDGLGREVHVVAHVGDHRGRHLLERAALLHLLTNAFGHRCESRHNVL